MDIKAILEKDKTIFSEIRNCNNAEEVIKICHDRNINMTQAEAIEILSAISHNHDCHNSSEYKHEIVELSDAELESVAGGKGGTITSGWLTAYLTFVNVEPSNINIMRLMALKVILLSCNVLRAIT